MGITGMRFWFSMRSHRVWPRRKNGKKWEEYKNWVKILSDSYKRAILVRKNGEKMGNIEMKIGSNFEPRWIAPDRCIIHYLSHGILQMHGKGRLFCYKLVNISFWPFRWSRSIFFQTGLFDQMTLKIFHLKQFKWNLDAR